MCCGFFSVLGRCLCPADRPSPVFLNFTYLLNAPPAIASIIIACTYWNNSCRHSLETICVVLAAFHIYMIAFATRLQRRFDKPAEVHGRNRSGQKWCWGELSIGLFFLVAPTAFVLSVVAFAWTGSSRSRACPGPLGSAAVASGVLMIVYLCTMVVAILINLCVSVLFVPKHKTTLQGQDTVLHASYHPPTAAVMQQPQGDTSYPPPTLPAGAPPVGLAYNPDYPAYYVAPHTTQPAGLMVSSLLYPQSTAPRLGYGGQSAAGYQEASAPPPPAGGYGAQSQGYGPPPGELAAPTKGGKS